MVTFLVLLFFSSRRRHTRFDCDWSSDVCSSDLTPLVSDLNTEQNITTFFLVCEKEIRNTREGKPYLRLELGDRSGTIEARMWDQFEAAAKGINRDDFVKVQARVEMYRDRKSTRLNSSHSQISYA